MCIRDRENGKLIMGLDDSFPPMGFRDEKNEIVGFDVDIAKEVTSRMGVELVLQPIDWKAKEMELKNKNVDVLWNGFTITEERKQELTFSEPYMYNEQIIVVLSLIHIWTRVWNAGTSPFVAKRM